jgi:hypothetical protein
MKRAIFGFFVVLAVFLGCAVDDSSTEGSDASSKNSNLRLEFKVEGEIVNSTTNSHLKDKDGNNVLYLDFTHFRIGDDVKREYLEVVGNSFFKSVSVEIDIDNGGVLPSINALYDNSSKNTLLGFFVETKIEGSENTLLEIFWLRPYYSLTESISRTELDSLRGMAVPLKYDYYDTEQNTVVCNLVKTTHIIERPSWGIIKLVDENPYIPPFLISEAMLEESNKFEGYFTGKVIPNTGSISMKELVLFGDIEFSISAGTQKYKNKVYNDSYTSFQEQEDVSVIVTITN